MWTNSWIHLLKLSSLSSGHPEIMSSVRTFTLSRGDNVTMDCQYTSNPVERVYKWQFLGKSIFMNTSDSHYMVTPSTLTVYNITPDDANVYICNVTNQCGSDHLTYPLEVIGKFMHHNNLRNYSVNAHQDVTELAVVWLSAKIFHWKWPTYIHI